MRKLILVSVALATLAAPVIVPAMAADMHVKAPILKAPPPVFSWTSCYLGVNGGWKWGRFRESADAPAVTTALPGVRPTPSTAVADVASIGSTNATSGAFGGQIGCRWETPEHWVWGFEGDFDGTNLRGSTVLGTPGPGATFVPGLDTFNDRLRWESSARFVLGHSWDRFLAYATAGIAFGSVSMEGVFPATLSGGILFPASSGSETKTLPGVTVGFGTAYAIDKNWEIGAEYRYTAFQKTDFGLGTVAGFCAPTTAVAGGVACVNQPVTGHKDLQMSEILFKLNYRFDWGAVVAKY
jgi:outer membrane immunogenic protein